MANAVLLKAANFAAVKHKLQKRKDAEETPYINHVIGVSYLLSAAGITKVETLVAALLHDTVEDTETTFDEIEAEFGREIRNLVAEVTDDKTLAKEERKRLQVVHARGATPDAQCIKMADKIYNLRDLKRSKPVGWTDQRVKEYFIWAKQVTDGCRGVNAVLEETLDEIYKDAGL